MTFAKLCARREQNHSKFSNKEKSLKQRNKKCHTLSFETPENVFVMFTELGLIHASNSII